MDRRIFFRLVSGLGALLGILVLVFAAKMWLGGVIVTPLGFLFGIGESSSYETFQEILTNLFWHVAPGLVGLICGAICSGIAFLLFWGSMIVWRKASELS
jgi:hypothetical protein